MDLFKHRANFYGKYSYVILACFVTIKRRLPYIQATGAGFNT